MARSEYTPQLAQLVREAPAGDEWIHEIKYDGYRIGCRIRNGKVTLISRNGNDWTPSFPEIAKAAAALPTKDALLDGEVAVLRPDGRTSFQDLQNLATGVGSRGSLVYFVFDLLRLNGERFDRMPLLERKRRLETLVGRGSDRIRYSDHVLGDGTRFLEHACRAGLEGIISKLANEPYRPGRQRDWVKTKCTHRQEFVIGGFTEPEGRRQGIGALLVGYRDAERLVFAGKVGTGFTHATALDLRRRLDRIERRDCPFEPPPEGPLARRAHWVKPELVCEVAFTEWTADGRIRHPSFQGLRADKRPADVRREKAEESPRGRDSRRGGTKMTPQAARRARRATKARSRATGEVVVAGVRITHPDRVLFEEPRTTKADLARYHERIADWVVPHVAGRPLTLVRCPEGLRGSCFYMKHSQVWAPAPLRRVRIREKTKVGEYLIADDLPAIVGLVQMGILEIHTWNSSFDTDVDRPNRIVIDLDPGGRVGWPDVVAAARTVRGALAALDLESFPKTTGGRGIHLVIPLVPKADWSDCLLFSRRLCEALERLEPDRYTTRYAKAGREDKILLDYLRNNRTNTSIAAYSTRAREGAPVSVPVTWDELRPSLDPRRLTLATVPQRLARLKADPWKSYWTCRQRLTSRHLRAIERGAVGSDSRRDT